MRFKVIIFSVIILILGFLGFYTNSYCLAQPDYILDSNSFGILKGGAFEEQYEYGFGSPELFVFGVDKALNKINTQLYNKYGWDLETIAWDLEDAILDGEDPENSNAFISTMIGDNLFNWASLKASGYALLSAPMTQAAVTNVAKQYILGKVDQSTGEISDVYDNAITYVDDNFFNYYQSTVDDMILSDDIIVLSNTQLPYYGNNLHYNSIYRNDFAGYKQVVADYDFYLYTVYTTLNGYSGYQVWAVLPYSEFVEAINTAYQWRFNGNIYTYSTTHTLTSTANYITLGYTNSTKPYTFTINGVIYAYGPLATSNARNGYFSEFDMGSLQNVQDLIETLSESAYAYSVQPDIVEDMQETLDQLKGHWVDSSDMARINEFIGDLPVSPDVPMGAVDYLPFIGASEADLAELQDLIDDILARSQAYDDVLGDPEVNPDPNPNPDPEPVPDSPNQGIDIPPNFPVGVVDSLLSALDTPFHFAEIFEPIFYVFGFFTQIYGLWLFAPVILIGALLIWSLK